jgi:phosphoglycolate phosphatase
LTDPAVGIVRSLQHALATLGRAAPPVAELTRFIGPPLRGTFAELLAATESVAGRLRQPRGLHPGRDGVSKMASQSPA